MSTPAFSEAELASIAEAIEATMLDTCTVDAYAELAGELNEPEVTYTAGPATPCRFKATAGMFAPGADFTLAGVDAIAHLPLATVVNARDRVTITRRYGKTLRPALTFQVIGEPVPGIASLELKLQAHHL